MKNAVKEINAGYIDGLNNAELLELLVGTDVGSLKTIGDMDKIIAHPVRGMGEARVARLKAIKELIVRVKRYNDKSNWIIHGPQDAYEYAKGLIQYDQVEKFIVLILDTKNRIISYDIVSVGSLSASIVHPREVFNKLILNHAASFIAVHNHPSGDPTPSREDKGITDRLKKAGNILDIPLLDHIVIGGGYNGRYISFKEEGLL